MTTEKIVADNPKIDIPERHQAFCKAVARLARQYDLHDFGGSYKTAYDDPWRGNIQFRWEQGRHGEDSDRIYIWSQLDVHTNLGPPKDHL